MVQGIVVGGPTTIDNEKEADVAVFVVPTAESRPSLALTSSCPIDRLVLSVTRDAVLLLTTGRSGMVDMTGGSGVAVMDFWEVWDTCGSVAPLFSFPISSISIASPAISNEDPKSLRRRRFLECLCCGWVSIDNDDEVVPITMDRTSPWDGGMVVFFRYGLVLTLGGCCELLRVGCCAIFG